MCRKGGKGMGGERKWEKQTVPQRLHPTYRMLSQPLGELVFAHKEGLLGVKHVRKKGAGKRHTVETSQLKHHTISMQAVTGYKNGRSKERQRRTLLG